MYVLEQVLQWKGLSSECSNMWVSRLSFLLNDLPHSEQEKGFLPVCTTAWRLRLPWLVNVFWHMSHGKDAFFSLAMVSFARKKIYVERILKDDKIM